MAEEFKLAGAYVEVRLKDRTSGDEKRIRAKIEGEPAIRWDTALKDPRNTEAVKKKVAAGKPVAFDTDLDERLAKAKAAEFVAKRRTAVIGLDADIAKLRAKLDSLRGKRGISVDVDARIAKAEAELAALVARRRTALLEVEAKTRPAEEELSRMAKRANAKFDALKFTGLSVGLPAAAAIGAAGVGASLTLIAGGFAALGTYIASTDEGIANKFSNLTGRVRRDAKQMGGAFTTEVSGALDDVGKSWTRLRPQISAAVDASAPAVRILTGAVTDFAEGAMPGMVTAVQTSRAPLLGFRALLGQTGTGLGEFFANASAGAQGAGQGMTLLGGIVQMLLSRFGTLFANLATGSAGPLNQLDAMLDALTGTLVDVTAHSGGVLGFLQGFGSGATGAAQTLRVLLGVIDALPPEVTGLAGSLKVTSMIMSKLGVDAKSGFKDFGQRVREAGAGMTGAQRAGAKFGAVVGGLAGGALNPAALAVGALGVGLNILGERQRWAAANAAAHADRVRTLSEALRASGGVVDETVRKTATEALGHYQIADEGFRNLNKDVLNLAGPQGLRQLQDAYLGNGQALDALKAKLTQSMREHTHGISVIGALGVRMDQWGHTLDGNVGKMDDTGVALSQLLDILSDGSGEFANAAKDNQANAQALKATAAAAREVTPAEYAANIASAELSGAFEKLNEAAGDTAAKGHAVVAMLRVLAGQTPSVDEAMKAWNDTMRGLKSTLGGLNLKKHAKDLIDASGAIDTVSESGSKLQETVTGMADKFASYGQALKDSGAPADQIVGKLAGMRSEFGKQLTAAGLTDKQVQALLEHYGMVPDKVVTAVGLEGRSYEDVQRKIGMVVRQLGAVPDRVITLTADDRAAAQALSALGKRVVSLPDGTFRVFSDTKAGQAGMDEFLAKNKGAKATVAVGADTKPAEAKGLLLQQQTNAIVGTITIDGNAAPADGKLRVQVAKTDGTTATMTYDARRDPASRQLQIQVQDVNGARGWMTIDAFNAAAKSVINGTVRVANDSTGWVQVKANTDPARGSVQSFMNSFLHSVITIPVRAAPGAPPLPLGNADGGLITHHGARRYASGGRTLGAVSVIGGGLLSGPGGPRQDLIPAWLSDKEFVVNAMAAAKWLPELMAINRGMTPQALAPRPEPVAAAERVPAPRQGPPVQARQVVQHFHVYPPAESDPRRVAASVSGQVGWAMRGV